MGLLGSKQQIRERPVHDVPPYPRMAEPATRSQMLEIARARYNAALAQEDWEHETYAARRDLWRASIEQQLTESIPVLIDLLEKNEHGIPWPDFVRFSFSGSENPVSKLVPPRRPYARSVEMSLKPALDYLESLEGEELTPDQRRILQRLGASYD